MIHGNEEHLTDSPIPLSCVQICFDNIVLVLANPVMPPHLYHNPTGNDPVIRLFKLYIRHHIMLTHRHITWFKKCRRTSSIRTVMNAVMDNGVIQADNTIAYGRFALSKCAQNQACRSTLEMQKLSDMCDLSTVFASQYSSGPAITAKLRHRNNSNASETAGRLRGSKRKGIDEEAGPSSSHRSKRRRNSLSYISEIRRSWRAYLEDLLKECEVEREEKFQSLNKRRTRRRKQKVSAPSLFEVLCSEMLQVTKEEDCCIIASQLGDCCSVCGLLLNRENVEV